MFHTFREMGGQSLSGARRRNRQPKTCLDAGNSDYNRQSTLARTETPWRRVSRMSQKSETSTYLHLQGNLSNPLGTFGGGHGCRLVPPVPIFEEFLGNNDGEPGARRTDRRTTDHKWGLMVANDAPEKLSSSPKRWKLEGKTIPICEEYTYLGMQFDRELRVPRMMSGRLKGAKRTLRVITPFLRNRTIPTPMKVEVVRAVFVAELLFGAEVYGMCRRMTDAMQTYLNQVSRMALDMKHDGTRTRKRGSHAM